MSHSVKTSKTVKEPLSGLTTSLKLSYNEISPDHMAKTKI